MKDKKILIVDFDEESLSSLSNLVLEEGFQVVTASDGLSGYEKFKADDFDLVILEPMLPKLHGFELCKRITQDPLKKTPIIVVTGIYREPSCKLEALQVYGASAFFTKPWNKDDLRSKMLQLLVGRKENKPENPAEPRIPARNAALEEREMLTSKAVPKEPKMSKDIDEIEKELQAAVASFAGPVRKKEIKEKKTESKLSVDKEIEAMLKGAIGELGLEEKKKRVETARPELKIAAELKPISEPKTVKPEPLWKTTSPSRPEPWSEKKEKITIAKEIKERIPRQEKAGNNIPRSIARARLEAEKAPFGIDRTLIEIDKIPLDPEKAPIESERALFEAEKAPAEKKSVFFDEYAEPRKKKTTFLVIGGLVAAIFLVSSGTFYILKSKKAGQASREMVSSLRPTLPTEFPTRQDEITASQAAKENEAKLESKKTAAKPAPQQASDAVQQIQPALPPETPPVQLTVQQPVANSESALPKSDQPTTTEINTNAQETSTQQPAAQPQVSEPAPATANEGDLIPVENVDVGPVQVKRVEPKYPSLALNMRLQGSVIVNALIDEKGNIIRTEILKGVKGGQTLEKAAEYALKQWKFKPAQKDGVNVKVWKAFEFNFKLNMPVKE
jgi:TonB family protein